MPSSRSPSPELDSPDDLIKELLRLKKLTYENVPDLSGQAQKLVDILEHGEITIENCDSIMELFEAVAALCVFASDIDVTGNALQRGKVENMTQQLNALETGLRQEATPKDKVHALQYLTDNLGIVSSFKNEVDTLKPIVDPSLTRTRGILSINISGSSIDSGRDVGCYNVGPQVLSCAGETLNAKEGLFNHNQGYNTEASRR